MAKRKSKPDTSKPVIERKAFTAVTRSGVSDDGGAVYLVYSFPSRVRCPRCKRVNTQRVSQRGEIQYRQCLSPVCRKRFPVKGALV